MARGRRQRRSQMNDRPRLPRRDRTRLIETLRRFFVLPNNLYTWRMNPFGPIFRALNEAEVRYVIVGGLATVLHGHTRLTLDIDLVVDLEPSEAKKAIQARPKDLEDIRRLEQIRDREEPQ